MTQYDLTSTQKATLRKKGHMYITRNGKKIRVTPSMARSKSSGAGIPAPERTNVYNVYATGKKGERLRAVMISGHWRVAKYVPKGDWWEFLDEVEYSTAANALRKYI